MKALRIPQENIPCLLFPWQKGSKVSQLHWRHLYWCYVFILTVWPPVVGLISLSLGDLQGHLHLSCSPCTSAKPFEENRLFSGAIHWTWWRCLCLDEMTCILEDGVVSPHDYKRWQGDFRCVYLPLTRGIPHKVPRTVSECWGSPEMFLQEHNLFHGNIVNQVGLNWP